MEIISSLGVLLLKSLVFCSAIGLFFIQIISHTNQEQEGTTGTLTNQENLVHHLHSFAFWADAEWGTENILPSIEGFVAYIRYDMDQTGQRAGYNSGHILTVYEMPAGMEIYVGQESAAMQRVETDKDYFLSDMDKVEITTPHRNYVYTYRRTRIT